MSVREAVCSAELYCFHPELGFFHPIQRYYSGTLLEQIQLPTEKDHQFQWVSLEQLRRQMKLPMQLWAVERARLSMI